MLLKVLGLSVLMLAAVDVASADSLNLLNAGSNTMGGVYVGPYNFTGTINGNTGSFQLDCDDFSDEVTPPETWNVTTSSSLATMSYADHVGSPSTVQEQEIAYLTEQMFQNLGNASTVGAVQWAIWDIFAPGSCGTGVSNCDPYGTISSSDKTNINTWLTAASTNYASGNYSNLVLYTPVAGTQVPFADGPPQQFIGISGPQQRKQPVPEPGVLTLVAMGLFTLVAFRRRFAL